MNWLERILSFFKRTPAPIATFIPPAVAQVKPPILYRVGISPGHGGEDPGAIGADGSHEADLARNFASALFANFIVLKKFNPAVYGNDETKKNYAQRVADSNANKDTFYIPCHFNSCDYKGKNGWLILLDPEDLKVNSHLLGLASSILTELQVFCPLGFADWDTKKDGVMVGEDRPIYELSKPKAYTIYLELGYISNPEWCAKLHYPTFMLGMAEAVTKGFSKYLELIEFKV